MWSVNICIANENHKFRDYFNNFIVRWSLIGRFVLDSLDGLMVITVNAFFFDPNADLVSGQCPTSNTYWRIPKIWSFLFFFLFFEVVKIREAQICNFFETFHKGEEKSAQSGHL